MTHWKKHPLGKFLADVACGWKPTANEIDAAAKEIIDNAPGTRITAPVLRRRLSDTVQSVAASRAEGHKGEGRSAAEETAYELIEEVGEVEEPPGAHANEMDANKLADLIER